jgi:hypothetical protein
MTTALRPALRIVRSGDDVRDAELDLALVERSFEKWAEMGARTLTPLQLKNFAQIMRRGRVLLANGRTR